MDKVVELVGGGSVINPGMNTPSVTASALSVPHLLEKLPWKYRLKPKVNN